MITNIIKRRDFIVVGLLLTMIFGVFSLSLFNLPAASAVGIVKSEKSKTPDDNGWLIYSLNPGESKQDSVLLTNASNKDVNVEILGRDAEITSDGVYTVISNKLTNRGVGDWVKFESNTISIPATKTIEVPFTLQVPNDAQPGEYGGGVAVLELGEAEGNGNVNFKTRNAIRLYATVNGSMSQDNSLGNLNIIDPSDEDYLLESSKRGYIGKDNIVAKFEAENIGDIYTNFNGGYVLTLPDGSTKEGSITQLLAPGFGKRSFYIRTDEPFAVGEIKLRVEYQISPLIPKDGVDLNIQNQEGVLEDILNITQDQLDNFGVSRLQAIEDVREEEKTGTKTIIVKEKESFLGENDRLLIGIAVFLLVVIAAFQIYNATKKNKNK